VSERVQSIERAIDLLMALSNGPRTLTEVARETGLSKATTFRILASLGHESLVVKEEERGAYMLGLGFLRLTQGLLQGAGAVGLVARPTLEDLREKTGETITIHIRVGLERMCVQELASPSPLRYNADVGTTAPLHTGSAGRVLLALMEPPELERTFARLPLTPIAPNTITDAEALRKAVDRAREQGYSMSSAERLQGAAAISVPVRGAGGLGAALSILGPDYRLPESRRMGFLPDLWRAAEEVSSALSSDRRPGAVSPA